MNAQKAKFPFKSTAELDNQIKGLEAKVDSGSLKLVEERKLLNEISSLRKSRKTVESFAAQQASIEADRKQIDEIKAQLDNPEAKAASDKYNALKDQLDEVNKKADEVHANKSKIYEERDAAKQRLDDAYTRRKELKQSFRDANDAYWTKVNEDRTKRMERQRAERTAIEEAKRKDVNERLLEEASAPAYEREIEDCRTLIDYFSRGTSSRAPALSTTASAAPAGVNKLPALDLRTIESALPEGATALKKKGQEEEMFYGGGGKKGGKKGAKKGGSTPATPSTPTADGATTPSTASSQSLNLPMSTLAALLAFNIPAPLSQGDVPKTVEALREKQTWFKDNQV